MVSARGRVNSMWARRVLLVISLLMLSCTSVAGDSTHNDAGQGAKKDKPNCSQGPVSHPALEHATRISYPDGKPRPLPSKGQGYRDEKSGVCIVRVTDHRAEPPEGFARNLYSRIQPFNADDSRLLVYASDGYWHLYDTDTHAYIKRLSLGGGSVEPQWHPHDPDRLFILPNKGGLSMDTFNVETGERKQVADFTELHAIEGYPEIHDIRDIWPEAARVWTRWEGSPSRDARYWAFQVETDDGEPLALISFDMRAQRVVGSLDIRDVGRPDHVSMSPSGRYVVAGWSRDKAECPLFRSLGTLARPCGLMVFTRDFDDAKGLAPTSPHSDIAVDAKGRDVIVISNYESGNVEMIDLESGEITPLWRMYVNGASTALHVSGKAYRKPGWVLISTYWTDDPRNADPWYSNRLMAVELKEDPRILNIARIPSRTRTYFSEPHAAVNRDFTRIVFNANGGSGKDEDIDVHLVRLEADAVPPARN